ncbi:MAG: ABC transporter permease [Gammaproteobacteria bacterium]|nr:ABC transporter permease [Gammaproteobacteria bacterium]MBU1655878.1 ABC transporter permease [Gammaproteobacteria bacterium]MBU1960621.1 ABC transporter permease [Gammaproteobacteria bacterium]
MAIFSLAWKSLLNRRHSALLTLFSIALSCTLLLGVERIRHETRQAFTQSVSGTDLVVGARSGAVNLLLYSVFHIGNPTNNISWQSYQELASHPKVAWTIPISLGDSHRGYRVVGTSVDFFTHYKYGAKRPLTFSDGRAFDGVYEAVAGSEVAKTLGYHLDQRIVIAHGAGNLSFSEHGDKPFRLTGILAPTGTPVDRSLFVSLQGITAIHVGWQGGAPVPGLNLSPAMAAKLAKEPDDITAFLVGLKSKIATFNLQRHINEYPQEPLTAVLPGVALGELWGMMALAEKALMAMSAMVVLVGLVGMLSLMLSALNERRREMAILRALGANPWQILLLVVGESLFLTLSGILAGLLLLYALLWFAQPLIQSRLGLYMPLNPPGSREGLLMAAVVLAGLLAGLVPGLRAYYYSLADGMNIRV